MINRGTKLTSNTSFKYKSTNESIGNLKSLQLLDLRNNELLTLPESITNLKSIKALYLQNNKFTTYHNSETIKILEKREVIIYK